MGFRVQSEFLQRFVRIHVFFCSLRWLSRVRAPLYDVLHLCGRALLLLMILYPFVSVFGYDGLEGFLVYLLEMSIIRTPTQCLSALVMKHTARKRSRHISAALS